MMGVSMRTPKGTALGWLITICFGLLFWVIVGLLLAKTAGAAPYMGTACKLQHGKTYTVSIDPDMTRAGVSHEEVRQALGQWNYAFHDAHGYWILTEHFGEWQDADFLITDDGWTTTWVQTRCSPGYVQRGNNVAIAFIGRDDAAINRDWIAHEFGHLLGFSDWLRPSQQREGHIQPGTCGAYGVGPASIMSYCWSSSELICLGIAGIEDDCTMIRDYWRR